MPNAQEMVIDTGSLIALVAAVGGLAILDRLYKRVVVPLEVAQEIMAGGLSRFAAAEFDAASWIEKRTSLTKSGPVLRRTLGPGEAAVIQCALAEGINTVAIDEAVARRVARLYGLSVTGSLGILVRAKRAGLPINLRESIDAMRAKGIWLSEHLIAIALKQAGE